MVLSEMEKREDFKQYKEEKKRVVEEDLPLKGTKLRKSTRGVQRLLLRCQRIINGHKVEQMGNYQYSLPKNKPIIFVVSHIGKWDFEIVNEFIKEQFYVLASDYYNMHGNFNEFMMNWFGVYFVDELDKEDKYYTSEITKKTLRDGYNSMILSEGTWNISPNEIIMDTHYGAVDAAMTEKALILPISVEQYDKKFIINFGELLDVNLIAEKLLLERQCFKSYKELNQNDKEELELKNFLKNTTNIILRDLLATLKMEIWLTMPVESRESLPEDYWEKFIEDRKREWPGYSMDEQYINTVHTKEKTLYNDVINDLIKISINHTNILSAKDLSPYLTKKQQEILINESLDRLRENNENNPIEPIEIRLEKYKQLKLKK